MNETIIGALQEYLDQCPLLEGRRLNVDYLTRRPLTYMISPSPVDSLVRQYHGGSAMRQFVFVLASSNLYGEDVLTNISNSGFFRASGGLDARADKTPRPAEAAGQPHGSEARSHIHRVPVQRNSNRGTLPDPVPPHILPEGRALNL